MMQNIENILDKNKAEIFLNKKSLAIFGEKQQIKVKAINRSYTYNPDSYNLQFVIEINKKERRLRLATSLVSKKKSDYQIMRYFYNDGFKGPKFFVPKPLVYFEDDNLLVYEDINSIKLTDLLNQNEDTLRVKISQVAELLMTIHQLPLPSFSIQDGNFFFVNFNQDIMSEYYPTLAQNLPAILNELKSKIDYSDLKFCHGDFNPNNLLFQDMIIHLIDFGSICYFVPEIDLASFFSHLRLMLNKINRLKIFGELKQNFFQVYRDYNQKNFYLLSLLIDLRLLEIAMIYKWFDYNESQISFLYSVFKQDLSKTTINIPC